MKVGDNRILNTQGIANFGVLKNLIVCDKITLPLISVSYLSKILKFHTHFYDNKVLILKKIKSVDNQIVFKILLTATLSENDNLYHIDDMNRFKEIENEIFDDPSSFNDSNKHDIHSILPIANYSLSLEPYSPKEIKNGSARVFLRSTRASLSLMQWLHVRLGHASESVIKHFIRHDAILGSGVSWKEIQNLSLGTCDACMRCKMKSFPIPPSISRKIYDVFEYLTSDYVPFKKPSARGYTGLILYVDKASTKMFGYLVKKKSEWLSTFQLLLQEHGPERNHRSHPCRFFATDYATEVHSTDFASFLKDKNISLLNSAPYKHSQNLIERFVQTFLNMLRCIMTYNNAPAKFWCYASTYTIYTYNKLGQIGNTITRDEGFSGEKPDVSHCVPFYAQGWAFITDEERMSFERGKKVLIKEKARSCRMLGYPEPYRIPNKSNTVVNVKNSYIIYIPSENVEYIRHDCYFNNYPDQQADLLSSEVKKHSLNDILEEENAEILAPIQEDYNSVLGSLIDPDDWLSNKQLISSREISEETSIGTSDISNEVPISLPNNDAPATEVIPEISSHETSGDPIQEMNALRSPPKSTIEKLKEMLRKASEINKEKEDKIRNFFLGKKKIKSIDLPAKKFPVRKTSQTKPRNSLRIKLKEIALENKSRNRNRTIQALIASSSLNPPPAIIPSVTPTSVLEALSGPDSIEWLKALNTEMDRLEIRNTWEIISEELIELDSKPIKSKFAFRVSIKPDGSLKYRCRLVACGYSQIFGLDYDETFAPTAKYKSLCIILNLAALFNWEITGIDVENAFVEANIDKTINMQLPKDVFCDPITNKPVVVRLKKSLYGLKQAGELWNKLLNSKLIDLNFKRLIHDRCVYINRNSETGSITIIIVYVDDVLFVGNDKIFIDEITEKLSKEFTKISELGEIKRYVGVDIQRDVENHTIHLSQKPYTIKYIDENISESLSIKNLPLAETVDYSLKNKNEHSLPPIQDKIGALRFLADRTRPDILTAIGQLGSAAANPTPTHLRGVEHLGRYLKGSTDYAIKFGGTNQEINLFGYSDASHLPHGDSKPRLGYCFFLNLESGAILARSFKGKTVSHSSCESEIDAINVATKQVVWLRGFLEELGFPQTQPTVIYTDSKSAKTLSDTFQLSNNSEHITMRINYIHESINNKLILLKYINTENQVADILTKILPVKSHNRFSEILSSGHDGIFPTPIIKEPKPKSDFKLDRTTGKFIHRLFKKKKI